jgi:integrase
MNTNQKAPIALTPEELRALLEATREDNRECYVAFLIAVAHGLRVSELIELRRSDFEENGNKMQLTVQRLKGSMKTTQDLLSSGDPLFDELTVVREYIKDLRPNDRLFNLGDRFAIGRLFQKYARRIGLSKQKRHIHCLKHTAGIMLRKAGADVVIIKEALGHRSLQSTMQYMKITAEEIEAGRQRALSVAAAAGTGANEDHSPKGYGAIGSDLRAMTVGLS